ncbi:DUF1571 domain-containing protein [bacterium]|nr:DUF1571 domain-containing protein [bacterium]
MVPSNGDRRPATVEGRHQLGLFRARLLVGLILFFVLVGAYYVGIKGSGRSAINRWKPQVVSLWQGEDIYLRYGFPTPPIMVILLTPFCLLPGSATMIAWFAFKASLVTWVFLATARVVDRWRAPLPMGALLAALAFSARPVMGDLLHGNVNLWVLFLVMAGMLFFLRGWDLPAGLMLSLAVACKLTPALVVIYFAWKRQFVLVGYSLMGLLLWWWLVPSMFLGFDRNTALLDHWADYMVRPYVSRGAVETLQTNQSGVALLHRMFSQDLGDEGLTDSTSVDAGTASVSAKLFVAGMLLLVGWSCRTTWSTRLSPAWWHELGIVLLAMLLISERSWKHHFVWLVPISLALVGSACSLWADGRRRSASAILFLMTGAFFSMLLTSQDVVRPWAGESAAKMMQAWGAYVWASLFLMTAHVIALKSLRDVGSKKYRPATTPIDLSLASAAARETVRRRYSIPSSESMVPSLFLVAILSSITAFSSEVSSEEPTRESIRPPTIVSALEMMEISQERLGSLFDYRCRIVRERTLGPNNTLVEEMLAKFREEPASVYLRWRKPIDGQELIWVDGRDSNILAHGALVSSTDDPLGRPGKLVAIHLPSDGAEARSFGIAAIVDRIHSRWKEEAELTPSADVTLTRVKVNERSCYVVTVAYPFADTGQHRFHTTRVYVDKEYLLPTRVEEFGYPEKVGKEPGLLLDAWTILDLRVNSGIQPDEFTISHPDYHFSRF